MKLCFPQDRETAFVLYRCVCVCVCNRERKQMTSLSLFLSVSFTCSFQLLIHSHTFGERLLFLKQRNRGTAVFYSQLWSVCKDPRVHDTEKPSSVTAVTNTLQDLQNNYETI